MNVFCRGLIRTSHAKRLQFRFVIRSNSSLISRNEYDALIQSAPVDESLQRLPALSRSDVKLMLKDLDSLLPSLDPVTATATFARIVHDVLEMRMFALSTTLVSWFTKNQMEPVPMRSHLAAWYILIQEVSKAKTIGFQQLLTIDHILQTLLIETQAGRVVDHRILGTRTSAESIVHLFGAKPWLLPTESIFAFETLCDYWNKPSLPSRARALICAYGRSKRDGNAKMWLDIVEKHYVEQGRQQYAGVLIARTIYWASPHHTAREAVAGLANLAETVEPDVPRKVQLYTLQNLLCASAKDRSVSGAWLRDMIGVVAEQFRDELSADWRATINGDVITGLVARQDHHAAIDFWYSAIASQPEAVVRPITLISALRALIAVDKSEEALDTFAKHALVSPTATSDIPVNSPLTLAYSDTPVNQMVMATTTMIDVLLADLYRKGRLEAFDGLWQLAFSRKHFGELAPSNASYVTLFYASIAYTKQPKNFVSLFTAAISQTRSNICSPGVATSIGWMRLEYLTQSLGATQAVTSPPNTLAACFDTAVSMPFKRTPHTNSFFSAFIKLLAVSGQSRRIPQALKFQQQLCSRFPSKEDLALASVLYEESGPTSKQLKDLQQFMVDWVGERYMFTEEERGRLFRQENIKNFGPSSKG